MHELFVQEAEELYRYACSLPGSSGCGPEELVQTAFHEVIVAWEKVSQFAPNERRKWLRRVLKNKAIDDWRKRRIVDLTAAVPESGPQAASPGELAELSIALATCWSEIRRMPPVRQIVAFLIWNEYWTTARVADHLGVAPSTVRGHIREARRQLIQRRSSGAIHRGRRRQRRGEGGKLHMNRDGEREAHTFAEVYRRARMAGARECPPFDLQRGLNELLTWMDQTVEIVAEEADHRNPEPAPSDRPINLDVPAVPAIQSPQVTLRGRRKLLDKLLALARKPEDGPAVLTGVGGAGKSTVAAALAKRVHSWDRPVWWVSATDPASLSAGLVVVARQLGGSSLDVEAIARGAVDAPDRFWRLLERVSGEWLLVFDNADDPWVLSVGDSPAGVQDGMGWIRSSRRGLVLVTSRETDPRIWGAARLYPVGQLGEADAALVLRDLAPTAGDEDQARVLARRLDRLPLALHLAGSYLRSEVAQWSTFAAYGHALDKSGKQFLLDSSGAQAAHEPARVAVTRTAEISLDGLAHHGIPQARTVLRLASCYAPISIPMSMFESSSMAGLFGQMTGSRSQRHLMEEAVCGLRSVGLIENWPADSAAAGTTAISVHPVITDSNRICLDGPEPDSGLIRHIAVEVLVTATKRLRFDLPQDWPGYRLVGQHLLALLDTTAEHVGQEHLVMLLAAAANTARAFNRSGSSKRPRPCATSRSHAARRSGTPTPRRSACDTNSPGRSRIRVI